MITRRFLAYFLIVAGFGVVTTAIFEVYSLRKAARHAVNQHMNSAQTVAGYVRGEMENQAHHLRQLLRDLPDESTGERRLHSKLRAKRKLLLDGAGLAVLDAERDVIVADLDSAGLPPPKLLLPALRHTEAGAGMLLTDFWRGKDGKPHAALVVGHKTVGRWRAAVMMLHLDGDDFKRLFRFLVMDENVRLQLLDSQGVALYSTKEDERYESVVHGTYFSDKVRLGQPVAMRCHSCHPDGDREPVREAEITTVAPIPGTSWSVSVREGRSEIFAPLREVAYSSVALVSVILGAFVGFFLLLSRRVLKPVRRLVDMAVRISRGQDQGPLLIGGDVQDEFATLARSLEALRQHTRHSSTPGETGGRPSIEVRGVDPNTVENGSPREDLMQALERTLETVLAGLARIPPISSAMMLIQCKDLPRGIVRTRGVSFEASGPLDEALAKIGAERISVTPQELSDLGVTVSGSPETRSFAIKQIRVIEPLSGQLWIGLGAGAEEIGRYLGPTLDLIAAHLQNLLVRNVLYDQLRQEHDRKNRMLRHLFEADDEERRRIAREIHDETAQVLNALLVLLETFPDSTDPSGQTDRLERAKAYVEQILEETDRLIRRLRPAVLDDLGLVEAVRTTGQNLLGSAGIEFRLEIEGDEEMALPKEVEVAAYRVLQEAMTNVVKHAGAKGVRARIEYRPELLNASIQDDGRGMDLGWLENRAVRPRWGLLGIRERIVQLGGRVRFSAPADGGLKIEFEVPVPHERNGDPEE